MKLERLIFIAMALLSLNCFSQINRSDYIEIKRNILTYYINNKNVLLLTYKVYNRSKETIWLWIEKNDLSKMSDSIKIREYFYKKKNRSDTNFYQIAMDRNIEVFVPSIFDTFIKRIPSNNYFSIEVITKNSSSKITKQRIFNYLDNHVICLPEQSVTKEIPSLQVINPFVFFKEDFVILPL